MGNPGLKYVHTRHNVGFDALDLLAKSLGVRVNRTSCGAKVARAKVEELELVLAKPLSFMNLSGKPVVCLANANQVPKDRWIIIQDDIDLPPGQLRIKRNGSAGGHKGITSIHLESGQKDFYRIKIGVGRPDSQDDVVDFVLTRARGDDDQLLKEAVTKAAKAVLSIIQEGFDIACNKYNPKNNTSNGE